MTTEQFTDGAFRYIVLRSKYTNWVKGWIARVFQQGYFSSHVTITYAIMDNMVYLIIYISFEFWLFDNKNPSVGLWIYVDRYFSVLKYLQK